MKGNPSRRLEDAAVTAGPRVRPGSACGTVPIVTADRSGGPLELQLDLLDEDPHQPRAANNPGFSEKSLRELAASIRLRGVKTPISVRHHPSAPGRYIINHGARRYRGSRLAGLLTIPGFVDDDYSQADQVVENLHRNELTAREIADYIGRELARGLRKGEIAKLISKSSAFVSQHVTLLDLPQPIARVFSTARVKDVTVVNALVTAYRVHPDQVTGWLADETQEITRGTVRLLRDFLQHRMCSGRATPSETAGAASSVAVRGAASTAASAHYHGVLLVDHDGRIAHLLTRRRPTQAGFAWVRYEEGTEAREVNVTELKLLALVDA